MEQMYKYLVVVAFVLVSLYYTINAYRPSGSLEPPESSNFAFATLLSNFTSVGIDQRLSQVQGDNAIPFEADGYYLGTRYLNYMLRYHPETRTNIFKPIPLVVLATAEVEDYKIKQLEREGAEVVRIDRIEPPSWMTPGDVRYIDVLTKLRLWQLTRFDKICFIDADVLVVSQLDGVFEDPATKPRRPSKSAVSPGQAGPSAADLPESYAFAAQYETTAYNHPTPPWNLGSYFNAGFFVLAPSESLYNIYLSKLGEMAKGDWPGYFPEQDLLNDVHNLTGPLPWQILGWEWNAHYPTHVDLKLGVKSLHDKFWEEDDQNSAEKKSPALRALWRDQVRQMHAFYDSDEYRTMMIESHQHHEGHRS